MNPYKMTEGTEEEYEQLLIEGEFLFEHVIHDLNDLSDKYIHTKKTYRRQADYEEICIALAIFARKKIIAEEVMNEPGRDVQH